jgi:tryptophanase
VEQTASIAVDLPCVPTEDAALAQPFNGNIDIDRMSDELDKGGVSLVIITVTNNAAGGQPVSMANLEAARALCQSHKVPLFLDAARFAENAWFIQQYEPGFRDWTIQEVVGCMFSMADGFTLSAKKDGMANIGGVLATQSSSMAEKFRAQLPIGEGHPSYGGLAGRDLEAVAIGIKEAMDPAYLAYRTRSVSYLAEGLKAVGMPIVEPAGGHAVFIDAGQLLPQIPSDQFPAQALGLSFYLEGGVRGVEVGSLMFPDTSKRELLRLAMPRRTYTQAHVDYVIEVAERVVQRASHLRGLKILSAPPALRHFTAKLAWA